MANCIRYFLDQNFARVKCLQRLRADNSRALTECNGISSNMSCSYFDAMQVRIEFCQIARNDDSVGT